MTAYGGNLTVFHRFLFSGASVEDSEVIVKGGGLELHYGLGAGPFMSGREQKSKFTLKVCAILSLFKPQHSLARQSDAGQQGRLYKVYTSLQKSGSLCAVTELPSHALIAAGLGTLVNVSVLEEHSTLGGQLGEVSVQGDLHTSDCEANDGAHAEGKSLWR